MPPNLPANVKRKNDNGIIVDEFLLFVILRLDGVRRVTFFGVINRDKNRPMNLWAHKVYTLPEEGLWNLQLWRLLVYLATHKELGQARPTLFWGSLLNLLQCSTEKTTPKIAVGLATIKVKRWQGSKSLEFEQNLTGKVSHTCTLGFQTKKLQCYLASETSKDGPLLFLLLERPWPSTVAGGNFIRSCSCGSQLVMFESYLGKISIRWEF